MAKTPLSAVVVIDYQNVHLTAYDIFNRGGDRHESLIHPQLLRKLSCASVTPASVRATQKLFFVKL